MVSFGCGLSRIDELFPSLARGAWFDNSRITKRDVKHRSCLVTHRIHTACERCGAAPAACVFRISGDLQ